MHYRKFYTDIYSTFIRLANAFIQHDLKVKNNAKASGDVDTASAYQVQEVSLFEEILGEGRCLCSDIFAFPTNRNQSIFYRDPGDEMGELQYKSLWR